MTSLPHEGDVKQSTQKIKRQKTSLQHEGCAKITGIVFVGEKMTSFATRGL